VPVDTAQWIYGLSIRGEAWANDQLRFTIIILEKKIKNQQEPSCWKKKSEDE
jgi:hypothetical protein